MLELLQIPFATAVSYLEDDSCIAACAAANDDLNNTGCNPLGPR